MILIITSPEDEPASLVESRLRGRGAEVVRFDTAEFPAAASLTVSYRPGMPKYTLRLAQRLVRFDRPTAVWYRRPGLPVAHARVRDPEVRRHIEQDCRDFLTSVWDSLDCRALPGTPSAMKAAQMKASQMGRAQALGFEIAPTIFGNDPAEFLDLYRAESGRLISKITASLAVRSPFGDDFSRYTNAVTMRDVAHAGSVALCPIVLQSYVPKRTEIRVTVVGERVFAAEIHSQATHRTRDDWRRYDLGATPHHPHALPEDVAERCVRLVAQSGLSFGTIDLILTPDDRYVFLELNSSGEYHWIEELTGLPISDAIADYLLGSSAGRPDSVGSFREEICHA